MVTLFIALIVGTLMAVLSWQDASCGQLVRLVRELLRGPA